MINHKNMSRYEKRQHPLSHRNCGKFPYVYICHVIMSLSCLCLLTMIQGSNAGSIIERENAHHYSGIENDIYEDKSNIHHQSVRYPGMEILKVIYPNCNFC